MHGKFLLIALVLAGTAATATVAEDSLDRRLARISSGAADCGSTWDGAENRDAVNACVTDHFLKDRPFRVRFVGRCEDSTCATGLVLEARPGGLYVVHFDSEGCKPANSGDPFCGTTIEPCGKPTLVPQGKSLKLVCQNEYEL